MYTSGAVSISDAGRALSDTPRNDPDGHALATMDKETKHEMWLLAVGTALLELPVVAIVALMVLNH